VIRYSYLWRSDRDAGLERRPAFVLAGEGRPLPNH
jgi:hypothetical protein